MKALKTPNGTWTEETVIEAISKHIPGWESTGMKKGDPLLPSDYMTMALKLAILRAHPEGRTAGRVSDVELLKSVLLSLEHVSSQVGEAKYRVTHILASLE